MSCHVLLSYTDLIRFVNSILFYKFTSMNYKFFITLQMSFKVTDNRQTETIQPVDRKYIYPFIISEKDM